MGYIVAALPFAWVLGVWIYVRISDRLYYGDWGFGL